MDPTTRTCVQRRLTEGKTKREISRSLKRDVSRQIHRTLAANLPMPAA